MKNRKILCLLLCLFLLLGFQHPIYAQSCDLGGLPKSLPIYISNIINFIKIAAPIVLVIMGMIDFARATISSDEKQMKESQSRFIKRTFAAIIIFFVIVIVQFVFGAIGAQNDVLSCIDCFVTGNCDGKNEVQTSCYQCNADADIFKWNTNGGADSVCPSGYHIRPDITNPASCPTGKKACYQCNNRPDIYKWSTNGGADSDCGGGYHIRTDIQKESSCHN